MNTFNKALVTGAAIALMLPTLAFAHTNEKGNHDDVKANAEVSLKLGLGNHATATTSAAAVSKAAVRVQSAADFLASFNSTLSTKVAATTGDTKAKLDAKMTDYTNALASAKSKAALAISGSAQVTASNSTTTNASLLAQAKVDLKSARGFLQEARKDFFQIFRSLWNFQVKGETKVN